MAYTLNPGEFKHPITILRVTNKKDNNHIPIVEKEEYFKCKAKINNYKNTDVLVNNGKLSTEIKKFYFRYCNSKPIKYTDIILHNGTEYEIVAINHIQEGYMYYEVQAERKV